VPTHAFAPRAAAYASSRSAFPSRDLAAMLGIRPLRLALAVPPRLGFFAPLA